MRDRGEGGVDGPLLIATVVLFTLKQMCVSQVNYHSLAVA